MTAEEQFELLLTIFNRKAREAFAKPTPEERRKAMHETIKEFEEMYRKNPISPDKGADGKTNANSSEGVEIQAAGDCWATYYSCTPAGSQACQNALWLCLANG